MKKDRRKNKKTELRIQYVSIAISMLALIISFSNRMDSVKLQLPNFSMEIANRNILNELDTNRIIKIYNTGGQVVNPKISAKMQLKLYLQKVEYLDDEEYLLKRWIYDTEINNFFQENPYYSNSENAFIVYEKNANEVFDFMDYLIDSLENKGVTCELYSIQQFYEISYNDYRGKKMKKIFACGNNYDYLWLDKGDRGRYCQDNELIEIRTIPEVRASYSLPIMQETEQMNDIINDIIMSCDKHGDTQVVENGKVIPLRLSETEDYIYNEYGFEKGIRVKHDRTYIGIIRVLFWAIVLIAVCCIYCYKLGKRNPLNKEFDGKVKDHELDERVAVLPDRENNKLEHIKNKMTQGELAKTNHTFWRFSQSERGRSVENVFAEYIPGEVTYAKDKDKALSFADDQHIARCFMYGDTLTKLCFDPGNEKFKEMENIAVHYTGNILGEYETTQLLVEKNYSLSDVDTIKLLFSMVADTSQMITLFKADEDLAARLRRFGYDESAALVEYLKSKFDENIHITPQEMMEHLNNYESVACDN